MTPDVVVTWGFVISLLVVTIVGALWIIVKLLSDIFRGDKV